MILGNEVRWSLLIVKKIWKKSLEQIFVRVIKTTFFVYSLLKLYITSFFFVAKLYFMINNFAFKLNSYELFVL